MNELAIASAWKGPPQCEKCGIRHLVLFSALDKDEFALIHDPIDELEFRKGRKLYSEGDPAGHLFTIREGAVKLTHYLPEGSERIVRMATKGDVIGLETLLGEPYKQHAVSMDPVLSCRIPAHTIDRLNRESPKFHRNLMLRWQQAVDDADAWLTELGTGTARTRVARLLLRLCGEQGDTCFMPTREDIGAMVSISTESVSRITADFAREGILENITRNRVTVDTEALRAISMEN